MGLALIFPPATGSFSFFRNPYGLMLEALASPSAGEMRENDDRECNCDAAARGIV